MNDKARVNLNNSAMICADFLSRARKNLYAQNMDFLLQQVQLELGKMRRIIWRRERTYYRTWPQQIHHEMFPKVTVVRSARTEDGSFLSEDFAKSIRKGLKNARQKSKAIKKKSVR